MKAGVAKYISRLRLAVIYTNKRTYRGEERGNKGDEDHRSTGQGTEQQGTREQGDKCRGTNDVGMRTCMRVAPLH